MARLTLYRGTREAQLAFVRALVYLGRGLPDLRITSYLRRGDADSQHSLGTAADFGVATPEERRDALTLARRWRALGLTAIEETAATPGATGPHVHVQLFRAGQSTLVL